MPALLLIHTSVNPDMDSFKTLLCANQSRVWRATKEGAILGSLHLVKSSILEFKKDGTLTARIPTSRTVDHFKWRLKSVDSSGSKWLLSLESGSTLLEFIVTIVQKQNKTVDQLYFAEKTVPTRHKAVKTYVFTSQKK